MRETWVAGNWKMHGDSVMVGELLASLNKGVNESTAAKVLVIPPYPYLAQAQGLLSNSVIALGAQNLSQFANGAYTGEVSGEMLKDLGCEYVLVGHSERRSVFGERDEIIAVKFDRAQQSKLTPILCVGETQAQREEGQTDVVIRAQLNAVLDSVGHESLTHAMIAYEPVWAIGTGLSASPEQANAVHVMIRDYISNYNSALAQAITILYGGSVKPNNAAALSAQPEIDGFLVGGASLKAHDFLEVIQCTK